MGMGEPFHNYEASLAAIDRLNDKEGFNLGARHFTISTVGLVPGIRRFADEKRQVNLAVSLHAVTDELRSSMMPVNKKYPISDVLDACRYYVEKTNRRITFEWALIDMVNDTPEIAQQLAGMLKGLLCHVKRVIPLNPTSSFQGKGSGKNRVTIFSEVLQRGAISLVRSGCGVALKSRLAAVSWPHCHDDIIGRYGRLTHRNGNKVFAANPQSCLWTYFHVLWRK